MAVSQAFIFHFKYYSILHFAVCQLLCWAFLLCFVTVCDRKKKCHQKLGLNLCTLIVCQTVITFFARSAQVTNAFRIVKVVSMRCVHTVEWVGTWIRLPISAAVKERTVHVSRWQISVWVCITNKKRLSLIYKFCMIR